MEITIFGRTFHIFTEAQIEKLKWILDSTICSNIWYQIALVCLAIWILLVAISWFRSRKGKDSGKLVAAEYIVYIAFLLFSLILSRPAGERSTITWDKNFFMTDNVYHETSILMAAVKFCIFVPFGMMTKKLFRKAPMILLLAGSALTGMSIELVKYLFGRGRAAIGSAIVLAVGTFAGICIESVIINRKRHKGRDDSV